MGIRRALGWAAVGGAAASAIGVSLPWWVVTFGREDLPLPTFAPEVSGLQGRFGWLALLAALFVAAVGLFAVVGGRKLPRWVVASELGCGVVIVAVALLGATAPAYSTGAGEFRVLTRPGLFATMLAGIMVFLAVVARLAASRRPRPLGEHAPTTDAA